MHDSENTEQDINEDRLVPIVSIVDEVTSSYRDYAMSVIVSRALPDVRDGLKPVHRRILFAMHDAGNTHDKAYRKSARPVGEVMGKFHPHGDGAIYDALVRMAQDFTMSLPLLDGQGNYGSLDGDNAAAMRYTEVRLAEPANAILSDIGTDTVDFQENYDGKDMEPVVLPARFPNMLVNGAAGIAVGMATNIPPHNLGEVIDATLALIEDPDTSTDALIDLLPGPDFPTGGIIYGENGVRATYHKGAGRIVIRARTSIETAPSGQESIIIEEVPYQIVKADLVEKIAKAAKDKHIEGIESVRDESDRDGVRVVIGLKRDTNARFVLNQLWRRTRMQSVFNSNMVALDGGRPGVMNLRQILSAFVEFREEVVARRTAHLLRQARERSHLLCGLMVAVNNLDEVIAIIRGSERPADARETLKARNWHAGDIAQYIRLIDDPLHPVEADLTYRLSDRQARAILDLRMQRLTALGIKEIGKDLAKLAFQIEDCLAILRSRQRVLEIISNELREVRTKFAVPRRTEIVKDTMEILDEDLIPRREMVVIITGSGHVKRTPLDDIRRQRRGGKGLIGTNMAEDDFVAAVHVANTHDELLCFAANCRVYKTKTWQFPEGRRYSRGRPLASILKVESGVAISAITPIAPDNYASDSDCLVFAASNGKLRRSSLSLFKYVSSVGKLAFPVKDNASLVNVKLCTVNDDVLVATQNGRVNRFPVKLLRAVKSRSAFGAKGVSLAEGDTVIALEVTPGSNLVRSELRDYLRWRRIQHRKEQVHHAASARSAALADEAPPLLPMEDGSSAEQETAADAEKPEAPNQRWLELREQESLLLTIDQRGFGKLSSSHEYTARKGRTGTGLLAGKLGKLVAFMAVSINDQIVLTTNEGQLIRCNVLDISFRSRIAGGVRLMRIEEGERIVSVARIDTSALTDGNSD
ncbi:MAG: DNA gyrase subunit A [Rhodobacteraceae bacterium]|nr:DNA gyrase subunit A [Paracoccaceae bacterium]